MPVYERVLAQLASFDLTEAEGARVRSRVKWAEEGETSSRFFLRLEKSEELIVGFRNACFRVLGFFLPIPFYGLPCRSWGPVRSS